MDWARAEGLMKYWLEFPPVHVLLRHFVGYRGGESAPPSADPLSDFREIAALGGR